MAIPFAGIAQDTLDVGEVRIIANDLYKTLYDTVRVQDTTFVSVYDTTFVTDSTFVTVYDTSQVVDSVYTLVKNEAPTLRNVWWQHRREAGEPYNYFDIRGESTADSLVFRWSGEDIKKKTLFPDSAFTVTVKTQYLGQAEYAITGYDSLWTITNTDIINTALMDTLGGQTSITDIEVMALADTPYITVPWTAPASDLTDYVGYYDLSNAPQSWWDAVDTSDLGKARVAKDDAAANATTATELAFEMTDIDTVNQTGRIWFRWSGTLPATSPDDIRIYAPQASYTSYGVTDTFGRNAVWVNASGAYHMNQDPSGTAPQILDSSGNGYHATANGGMVSGDLVSGKIGDALNFGGGKYLSIPDGVLNDAETNQAFTIIAWAEFDTLSADRTIAGSFSGSFGDGNPDQLLFYADVDGGDQGMRMGILEDDTGGGFSNTFTSVDVGGLVTGQYFHVATTYSSSLLAVYEDGSQTDSVSSPVIFQTETLELFIGAQYNDGSRPHDGRIDEVRVFHGDLSADYLALDHANQNDPVTFWGTPTFVAAGGGGGTSISGSAALTDNPESAALAGSLTLAGQAAAVDNPASLAGLGSVSISASVAIVDNPEAISSDLALMLAGSSSMTGRPELASLAGTLSLAASGALTDNAESTQLQAVLLLSGSGALQDNPEQLSITGSFGDIIRGSASLVDNAEGAGVTGRLIIGGTAVIGDAPANMSINGNLLLAAQAALENSEESFQALCDVILSMSIALTDNPEQLLARQLVISDKVKIQVTGQRVGNTITISGERVQQNEHITGTRVGNSMQIEGS